MELVPSYCIFSGVTDGLCRVKYGELADQPLRFAHFGQGLLSCPSVVQCNIKSSGDFNRSWVQLNCKKADHDTMRLSARRLVHLTLRRNLSHLAIPKIVSSVIFIVLKLIPLCNV